jgi:hypothetical protein
MIGSGCTGSALAFELHLRFFLLGENRQLSKILTPPHGQMLGIRPEDWCLGSISGVDQMDVLGEEVRVHLHHCSTSPSLILLG